MKLHIEQEINAPADKVWEILAHQFAEVANWAPNIETSRLLDASEVPPEFEVAASAPIPGRATPNPLGELKEIFTMYSEANKAFTFQVAGLPSIINYSQNTTQVIEKGPNRCLVTSDLEMVPKGLFKVLNPVLRYRLQTSDAGPSGLLKELKLYAESGQVDK